MHSGKRFFNDRIVKRGVKFNIKPYICLWLRSHCTPEYSFASLFIRQKSHFSLLLPSQAVVVKRRQSVSECVCLKQDL